MRNGVVFYEDLLSAKGCHIGSPVVLGERGYFMKSSKIHSPPGTGGLQTTGLARLV
jgi:hypothetical protein